MTRRARRALDEIAADNFLYGTTSPEERDDPCRHPATAQNLGRRALGGGDGRALYGVRIVDGVLKAVTPDISDDGTIDPTDRT
ncbi:MAG: hypothetical protein LBM73_01740 [Candidatus Nomurabacteria bacterium]|jgi:hypothetical protein|nr:hypothetical protein [Candidatus Nomurabacteria bacterium]